MSAEEIVALEALGVILISCIMFILAAIISGNKQGEPQVSIVTDERSTH